MSLNIIILTNTALLRKPISSQRFFYMFRYFLFLLSIIFFSSCKTQYANFQESSAPSVLAKVKKKSFSHVEELDGKSVSPIEVALEPKTIEEVKSRVSLPIIIAPEPLEQIEQIENMSFEKPSADFFNPKQKEKPKPKKKKKKGKKFRQVSSNLFVGFIFLGIAIVLAFLKLPTLVTLFGLASIIFLAIGLKKVWKKKRRQSRFKDIFNTKK